MTALQMWRDGKSYDEIAKHFGLVNGGGFAERMVSEQRSEELKRPSPYEYLAWKQIA